MSDRNAEDGSAVYADAAARLERVLDAQQAALDDIDGRAMAVMRLVAALLAALGALLPVVAALDGRLPTPSAAARAALALAVVALVGTLVAASATYLGSRVVPGVGPGMAARVLDASPAESAHLRRVVITYAVAVRANRDALAVNARRFRITLLSLVAGLAYGAYGALALAFASGGDGAALLLAALTGALAVAWWYVLSGRYLTDAATVVPDGEIVATGEGTEFDAYPMAVLDRSGE